MGVTGKLVEAGLVLLGLGFFVSLIAAPVGFLLGRIGMLLIGIGLALPLLTFGVVCVFLVATHVGTQHRSNRSAQRNTAGQQRHRRRQRTGPTQNQPTAKRPQQTGYDQLDLDVDTIDDYRR